MVDGPKKIYEKNLFIYDNVLSNNSNFELKAIEKTDKIKY